MTQTRALYSSMDPFQINSEIAAFGNITDACWTDHWCEISLTDAQVSKAIGSEDSQNFFGHGFETLYGRTLLRLTFQPGKPVTITMPNAMLVPRFARSMIEDINNIMRDDTPTVQLVRWGRIIAFRTAYSDEIVREHRLRELLRLSIKEIFHAFALLLKTRRLSIVANRDELGFMMLLVELHADRQMAAIERQDAIDADRVRRGKLADQTRSAPIGRPRLTESLRAHWFERQRRGLEQRLLEPRKLEQKGLPSVGRVESKWSRIGLAVLFLVILAAVTTSAVMAIGARFHDLVARDIRLTLTQFIAPTGTAGTAWGGNKPSGSTGGPQAMSGGGDIVITISKNQPTLAQAAFSEPQSSSPKANENGFGGLAGVELEIQDLREANRRAEEQISYMETRMANSAVPEAVLRLKSDRIWVDYFPTFEEAKSRADILRGPDRMMHVIERANRFDLVAYPLEDALLVYRDLLGENQNMKNIKFCRALETKVCDTLPESLFSIKR
jgi:hypothetical protein